MEGLIMKKAPVSEPDQPDLPAPPKNSAQPMSGSASVIGSEVIPNPLEERLAELRDLFRSARFNRMDELDVYAGDFRSFRDLGSIVTADMRHQMERQLRPADEPQGSGSNDHRTINVTGSVERLTIKTKLPEMTEPSGRAHPIRITPELCLRRLPRPGSCRLCLNACPFGALQDAGGSIDFDHRLCQACGVCEAVCPTGAFQLMDPVLTALLSRIQKDLAGCVQYGGPAPTLVMHEAAMRTSRSMDFFSAGSEPVLWFEVDGIGRIGVEMLLAAVAWGAFRVVIWLPPTHSAAVKASVQREVRMAWIILEGLGQPAGRVSIAEGIITPQVSASSANANPPAQFAPPKDKRKLLRLAVRHLAEQCPPLAHGVDLPQGSPYGAVRVSAKDCTFCMACAGVCPMGALSGGQGLPCLRFVEALCVQCGLCAEVCPEQAITLAPHLLFDPESAESTQVLVEEAPFACIRCGTPFAPRRMIERMTTKLEGHWMYRRPEDLRRLQMCTTCRVRDLYHDSRGES
jgi:ferredoxin